MGVITVNLDLMVETWYRDIRSGQRSETINRILRNHIRARLGDPQPATVEECGNHQLINVIYGRIASSHGKSPPSALMDSIDQARAAAHQLIEYLTASGDDE